MLHNVYMCGRHMEHVSLFSYFFDFLYIICIDKQAFILWTAKEHAALIIYNNCLDSNYVDICDEMKMG